MIIIENLWQRFWVQDCRGFDACRDIVIGLIYNRKMGQISCWGTIFPRFSSQNLAKQGIFVIGLGLKNCHRFPNGPENCHRFQNRHRFSMIITVVPCWDEVSRSTTCKSSQSSNRCSHSTHSTLFWEQLTHAHRLGKGTKSRSRKELLGSSSSRDPYNFSVCSISQKWL